MTESPYIDSIKINVRSKAILNFTVDLTEESANSSEVEIPIKLKRCGFGLKMIVRAPGQGVKREPDQKMVALINQGFDWFEKLSSGRCDSLEAIGKVKKMDSSYVTRAIYLALFDPWIVQRFLNGDHPEDLTVKKLRTMDPFPKEWSAQRVLLGFDTNQN